MYFDYVFEILVLVYSHQPCGGQFVTPHMVRGCPASLSHQANDRPMHYCFSLFDHGGILLSQSSNIPYKGEMTYYPPGSTILQNFSPIAQTIYEICLTNVFSLFGLRGLTPVPKFTKKGHDLLATYVYHPTKFHRPTSTHAGDILCKNFSQTNKKTVNNISQHAYQHAGIITHTQKASQLIQ